MFDTLVNNAQANEAIGVGNTATKFLANVGEESSIGAELEGQARLFDGLKLSGFLGLRPGRLRLVPQLGLAQPNTPP